MSDEINVVSRTQQIIVEPSSASVSIINAGPPGGPPGPQGPPGSPGAGARIGYKDLPYHSFGGGAVTSTAAMDYGYAGATNVAGNNSFEIVYAKKQANSLIKVRANCGFYGTGNAGRAGFSLRVVDYPSYTNLRLYSFGTFFVNSLGIWMNASGHVLLNAAQFAGVGNYAFRLVLVNQAASTPVLACNGPDGGASMFLEELVSDP